MFSRKNVAKRDAALRLCLIAALFSISPHSYADSSVGVFTDVSTGESAGHDALAISAQVEESALSPKKPIDLELFARGERLFSKCDNCHTLGPEDAPEKNARGPNLYAIFGAKAGVNPNFEFSKAMKSADIIWDELAMDIFIQKPKNLVPKTSMSLWGIRKAEDREALIYYLKQTTRPIEPVLPGQ